jgi:endonuclease/exonuclease/phosphatase family metal-dependent hydrolase
MLKILSYNIHKGVCYYTRKTVLEELRQGIRAHDPDIVFLQEVRGHSTRAAKAPVASQFEYLADTIWPHHAYGKNAVYTKGHHGNAILSKFPIEHYHNLDISTNRMEKRGLLHAKVSIPKLGPLDLFCIHLDLREKGRAQQVEAVTARIQEVVGREPVILAGDFNDWRLRISDQLRRHLHLAEAGLKHFGRHAKTFPSVRPMWALDRIYYRGLHLKEYEVLKDGGWQKLSDHLAVAATFQFHE